MILSVRSFINSFILKHDCSKRPESVNDTLKLRNDNQYKRLQHWLAWREMIRPQAARRPQQHVGQCAVKWDRSLKRKLAITHQCTSVTDRRTDRLTSWHKREMYKLHLALKMSTSQSAV